MRARLALASAGIEAELREILLRDKPQEMLEASPKGTVPVLVDGDQVVDESRDIMDWALARHDPEGWRDMPDRGEEWIAAIEGPFKTALDRYKYHTRYEGANPVDERGAAASILWSVDDQLRESAWLFGDRPTLADMATVTFVRQFANTDRAWFDAQDWGGVRRWLDDFTGSDRFAAIMTKYPQWSAGDVPVIFPDAKCA